ncbi:hypothetical protein EVJ58_g7112 [Rhodofomes roseus]|uniref:N-acetyltransferase domain-containing protein n=1 Tax=Rhodofomes roseus TaxID=34475 RepID=A0A4Y9Y499_9APHY|nr:hypothetical protein EVJ58_g7112 [Rhodofomes roseus]
MSIFYDSLQEDEVEEAYNIEAAGYPPDEAASLDALKYRQTHVPDLFLGAYIAGVGIGRKLIGYVCATLSPASTLSHESMSTHIPGAPSVCIHSVCVAPTHRKQGIALALLQEYLARLERTGTYERVLLITHEELRGLYERAGFEWVGPSPVTHGSQPWFEMQRELRAAPEPSAAEPIAPPSVPAGLWEALQRSATARNRPTGRALAAFPNGAQDLVVDDGQGALRNKNDLLCPREGACGGEPAAAASYAAGDGELVAGHAERDDV